MTTMAHSQRVVQKFGGSSVADAEKLRLVARRVADKRALGFQVVVVVSAQGKSTDELLAKAKAVSADPPHRELDMLLSCGERISMALLAICLNDLGVPARSLTGSQSGIITDEKHAQARIVEVRPARIEAALANSEVAIVAGYQGVSTAKEVTTLGRGGSDTTAVALAAALGADCEIYSDVDGVYSADPRIVESATRVAALSFDEMLALSKGGARVLNAQAIEYARDKGIRIFAKSAHTEGAGTKISVDTQAVDGVRSIASDSSIWFVESSGPARPLLAALHELRLETRRMWISAAGQLAVTISMTDVHHLEKMRQVLSTLGQVHDAVSVVTCVGSGFDRDLNYALSAHDCAQRLQMRIYAQDFGAAHLSLVVERTAADGLVRALHQRFISD
jgi:aspartate kinase